MCSVIVSLNLKTGRRLRHSRTRRQLSEDRFSFRAHCVRSRQPCARSLAPVTSIPSFCVPIGSLVDSLTLHTSESHLPNSSHIPSSLAASGLPQPSVGVGATSQPVLYPPSGLGQQHPWLFAGCTMSQASRHNDTFVC